jgi:hypothetical protein
MPHFTPIEELPMPPQFMLEELENEEQKEILLNEYMKDILESHPVANLKAILRKMKQDVGSYSKMKKAELINRIMELKKKGFPVPKVEKYVKPERKKAEPKKAEKKPAPKKAVTKKPEPEKKPAPSNKVISTFESKYKKIIEKMPKAKSLEELDKLNIKANDVTSTLDKETDKFTLTQEQSNRINELTKQVNKTFSKRTKELIEEKKPEPEKTETEKKIERAKQTQKKIENEIAEEKKSLAEKKKAGKRTTRTKLFKLEKQLSLQKQSIALIKKLAEQQ